jgi:hypothetical protein
MFGPKHADAEPRLNGAFLQPSRRSQRGIPFESLPERAGVQLKKVVVKIVEIK